MIEKIGHIKNPLTVIAIFAGIAEISGTAILPFISTENQSTYIWFLMAFPFFLVTVFFLTLNFNYKTLYSPSDYRDENNFTNLITKASSAERKEKLRQDVEEVAEGRQNEPPMPSIVPEIIADSKSIAEPALAPPSSNSKRVDIAEVTRKMYEEVAATKRLALRKLSAELKLALTPDVRINMPLHEVQVFDAVAITEDTLHAVEVKFLPPKRLDAQEVTTLLLNTAELAKYVKREKKQSLVLHLLVITDAYEDKKEMFSNLVHATAKGLGLIVNIHFSTSDDLKNFYEWG